MSFGMSLPLPPDTTGKRWPFLSKVTFTFRVHGERMKTSRLLADLCLCRRSTQPCKRFPALGSNSQHSKTCAWRNIIPRTTNKKHHSDSLGYGPVSFTRELPLSAVSSAKSEGREPCGPEQILCELSIKHVVTTS